MLDSPTDMGRFVAVLLFFYEPRATQKTIAAAVMALVRREQIRVCIAMVYEGAAAVASIWN